MIPDTPILPVDELAAPFRQAMETDGCAIVTAPTGSGKSTRIPRMLLGLLPADGGQVLVLQPRRLAARMLAERVAWEMGEETGSEYQVIFRSYTGSFVYFYVDKTFGTARLVEYVPSLDLQEDAGSIDLFDYLA